MRISDWSSDVCSSDLVIDAPRVDLRALDQRLQYHRAEVARGHRRQCAAEFSDGGADRGYDGGAAQGHVSSPVSLFRSRRAKRSEERRVGKGCVSTCSTLWLTYT